jgi:hypothetical protein
VNLLTWIYSLTLRLYPPGFRREYAEEMRSVFTEALQDASMRGRSTSARIFLREIADLPANLLRQFWTIFYDWILLPWQDQDLIRGSTSRPGSWLSAGLAGLPHLLYALALYLPLLVTKALNLTNYHGPGLPMLWGTVIIMLLIARRLGWPGWSASWVGYGLVFLLSQINVLFPIGLLSYLTGFIWLIATAIVLFWLARRSWISGLLAVLPISPMWIWLARREGITGSLEEAALYVSISLMVMLAVAAIVRLGRWQTALLLMLAVILAIGMPGSSSSPYPAELALAIQPDTGFWNGNGDWLSSYLLMLVLTAPLWLMALAKHGHPFRQVQRSKSEG